MPLPMKTVPAADWRTNWRTEAKRPVNGQFLDGLSNRSRNLAGAVAAWSPLRPKTQSIPLDCRGLTER